MKYSDWLDEWYKNYIEPTAKHNTKYHYTIIIEKRLKPALGKYEPDELTPRVLQRFVTELLTFGNKRTGRGLATNSVIGIVNAIQASLKLAYETGELKNYTADKIRLPKADEKKVLCFSRAEQREIELAVTKCNKRKMFGVVVCLYTGLRIGELLALTWNDVDLKNGELTVDKACHDFYDSHGYTRLTGEPKTASSKRIIPLPKNLIRLLREQKKKALSGFVIESRTGKPVSVRSYQRSFELLLKNSKIEKKCFHSLRHTFATRALECGMDVKTLSEILGHKNATITLNRYVHSLFVHKKEMMNRLEKSVGEYFTAQQ